MSSKPLVSVICLCHNQAPYVKEAISSVLNQSYKDIELIIVDDGSTDESKEVITSAIGDTDTLFISNSKSEGNCKAFNKGFRESRGSYIIDLAADDALLPSRIMEGLKTFQKKEIGVEFCNVMNIDRHGKQLDVHFKKGIDVPEGGIYRHLIERYIISPPGMMIQRKVLEDLNGYDEFLHYEDFDFWIRSSRTHEYGYTNNVLVNKRILKHSHSKSQFKFRNKHQKSTLEVCEKILELKLQLNYMFTFIGID